VIVISRVMSLVNSLASWHCKGVCDHTSCLLSIIRGFRNGAIYGAKIRAPHALIMTFLFREGSFYEKLNDIMTATFQHSRNLACYVAIYKAVVCFLRHLRNKESGINTLVGGAVGGFFIFGTDNPVNSQINMYILSRVILASIRTFVNFGWVPSFNWAYGLYASVCWALVMYLFHYQPGTLQKSLISSMTYLYLDSNIWTKDAEGIIDWFSH